MSVDSLTSYPRYFAITHKAFRWRLPAFMTLVGGGPDVPEGCRDLTQEYPETKTFSASASEFRQLFAMRRLLEDEGEAGQVGVGHYRRFAIADQLVTSSGNYNQVLDPAAFEALNDDVFLVGPGVILAPMIINLGMSVQTHYAQTHELRDLLYFFALAIDLEVITNHQAAVFLGGPNFIPAPSIGLFPAGWLIQSLAALERVVVEFEGDFLIERAGYQGRSVAFCCERLLSLLLQMSLSSLPTERLVLSRALVVSEDGAVVGSSV